MASWISGLFGGGSKPQAEASSPTETPPPPSAAADSAATPLYRFRGGVCLRPHDEKVHKGGEDAYTASKTLLAVADGVGGWASKGVDPGLFAKQLCRDIQSLYDKNSKETLKNILVEAVKMNRNTGSSTACLASIDENSGLMKTTNLGDSGYVIWRVVMNKDAVELQKVFRSKEQQYRFNFPYQCGTNCDLPYKAYDTEHQMLSHTDLVVMGTDGLLDNVYDDDMKPCLTKQIAEKDAKIWLKDPTAAAECIGQQAYVNGKNRNYDSPFAKGAREHGKRYMGGKEDDITVIVAQVVQQY